MNTDLNEKITITLNLSHWLALHATATKGYNAEITYKTARPKGERPSERAMRRAEASQAIDSLGEQLPEID